MLLPSPLSLAISFALGTEPLPRLSTFVFSCPCCGCFSL